MNSSVQHWQSYLWILFFCWYFAAEDNPDLSQNPELKEERQFYLALVLKVNFLKGSGEAGLELGSDGEWQGKM